MMNKDEAVQKLATAGRLSIAHAEDLYNSFQTLLQNGLKKQKTSRGTMSLELLTMHLVGMLEIG